MTRSEVVGWLAARRPAAPPTLVDPMTRGLIDSPESLPAHLALAGRALLDRVLARPEGGRELALDLLAADALVTYAFEAQAEHDAGGLIQVAERIAGSGA
ncbi:MAG TPA: hypothetical protein VFP39_00495 [Gemmatimonadales bacterium]|nr:hypothetical protein [Gemmatimonadales bacterium]